MRSLLTSSGFRQWHATIGMLLGIAITAAAQQPARGSIVGTVRDSVAHRPLADAIVQLVPLAGADAGRNARTARSDSIGRYSFTGLPQGRYLIGFVHPLLDSIGIPPVASEVNLSDEPLRVDLFTPVPAMLQGDRCGAARDSGGVVTGSVRDGRRRQLAGATVDVSWLEMTFGQAGGTGVHSARRQGTTREDGSFTVCAVPAAGTVFLTARRDGDSTDAIAVTMPSNHVAQRDLFLGRRASAPLSGQVTGPKGEPLSGATVAMSDGSQVRANTRGEWTVPTAPAGTRMIEVRAVGYYPERLVVDVIADAPPIRTSLSTTAAILDTVRVRAARSTLARVNGFDQRRRTGQGHFFTAEDVARINPFTTSALLYRVPGVSVDRNAADGYISSGVFGGPHQLTMRGTFTDRCAPTIYVDGAYFGDLDADDIDAFVPPAEIAGVEVYTSGPLPQEFVTRNAGLVPGGRMNDACGAIGIWTTPSMPSRLGWRAMAARVVGVVGAAALASYLVFR